MKNNLLRTLFAGAFLSMLFPLTASADVEINETNFPDANFRNWLLEQYYVQDGKITDEEIAGITYISVSSKRISSLKGIEYFTALNFLNCAGNQLTSLDVSKNTALTELHCNSNQLTSLDVSKNAALTKLRCDKSGLTSLDVSHNTELTELQCPGNQLTSLDVSKNMALTKLECFSNQLTSLDVSQNTALESLDCDHNKLTSLNLSQNTALTHLNCYSNQLTSLNLPQNTALTELRCYENQLKATSMNAFIGSLPQNTSGMEYRLYICYNGYGEGNVCTRSQVEAIIAKGWKPLWSDGTEYEGIDDPDTEIVSVGEDGLATYCPAFNIDFSKAEKIAAYKASVSNNIVKLTRVQTVAAGEGVLIRSLNDGEATEELPTAADAEKDADNAFVGTLTATTLSEKNGNITNFVLFKKNGVVGFYKANNTPIAAGKAYLPVANYDAEADARGLTLVFDDDNTTSISEIDNATTADDAIYTLNGARVKNPTKGLYIKNGKKVIVK